MGRPNGLSVKEKLQEFSKKNHINGCIEWQRSTDSWGYGKLRDGEKFISAHRASYIIHLGKIKKGLFVLHNCDNPRCVNPNHLFIGTHTDNMRDMASKGRSRTQKLSAKR